MLNVSILYKINDVRRASIFCVDKNQNEIITEKPYWARKKYSGYRLNKEIKFSQMKK